MDIISLLLKRAEVGIDRRKKDCLLEEIIRSGEDEIAIVHIDGGLRINGFDNKNIIYLFDSYKLKGMFELKNPYSNTYAEFFVYVFSKKWNKDILYSLYNDSIKGRRSNNRNSLDMWEEYPEDYFDYIEKIEDFVLTGKCPEDTKTQEFGFITQKERKYNEWNPRRYNKKARIIRDNLLNEKTVELAEMAEIIRPRQNREKIHTYNYLSISALQYPLNYDKLREGIMTDTPIKKGDIIYCTNGNIYLVYDELQKEIHISPNCFIIRPINICSEYLYLYLKSETASVILDSLIPGNIIKRVRFQDLKTFPIIIPEKKDDYYLKVFLSQEYGVYDIEQLNDVIKQLSNDNKNETIEDILDVELLENMKTYKSDLIEKILEEDLRELNICFRNKAYKATLILSGSILEAILIDWLSEEHKKNYFEEDYISEIDGERGSLYIYIRDLKELKHPKWMEEAKKADSIRKNRNKVHAKLCLGSNVINENLCREVVGYLEDVLKTRKGKMKKI
ncbi:MAG TPA: hypothetical protein DCW44_05410 [Eubacterium sp.]|nr:hypothetical protein [Eubacterium sp.]